RSRLHEAAEPVGRVVPVVLKFPGVRPAVAAWTFRGAGPSWDGFICRRFLRCRLLGRLLGFGSFLRDLLACDLHSTLHALTSRQALARLTARGEVADMESAKDSAASWVPSPLAGSSMHAS